MRGWLCALAVCACLAVGAVPAQAQVVALGDSYSSGEGAPPFEPGTDSPFTGCHRATRAWPLLVAARLGMAGRSYACSGAEIPDLFASQIGLLEGVRRARLVTLTIGGNDAGFSNVLRRCGAPSSCVSHYEAVGPQNLDRVIDDLGRRLPAVYERVQNAMPVGARLVVVGYPRLFPVGPDNRTCAFFGGISANEARHLNRWGARMNDAIRVAAARADAAHIDVSETFDGHEMSCRGEQWVNRLRFSHTLTYSFHPNLLGQRALAERVGTALGAPATALLRVDGLGGARFGMTRAEVRRALGSARPCDGDPLLEFDRRGRFVAYASTSDGALTEGMIARGDPVALVGHAYNDVGLIRVPAGPRKYRYLHAVARGDSRLVFEAARGNVTRFVAGARDRPEPLAVC